MLGCDKEEEMAASMTALRVDRQSNGSGAYVSRGATAPC